MNRKLRQILQYGTLLFFTLLMTGRPLFAQVATDPQTVNDESLLQPAERVVTIDVLANDLPEGPWIDSTVRIVNPHDMVTLLPKYVEPDQGIWEVNQSNGSISFTPCTGDGTPDPDCSTALNTMEPYPIDYVVEDSAQVLSNPASNDN